jgi:hypothetical protein
MHRIASLGALAGALFLSSLQAQNPAFPLPQTTGDTTANESSAPFLLPDGVTQTLLASRKGLSGLPATFGNWDMVAYDASGRYVFIPAEVGTGAGVFRYDTVSKSFVNLLVGNNSGTRESDPSKWDPKNDDFARLDPATLTPWGSVITGEETTGGRLFEITNPMASSGVQVLWRSNIPAVSHEGLRFDKDGNLYFIDEYNSGSIYKFVPATKGDLSVGQTFVLSVDAYASDANADASANWDATANRGTTRFGAATWVPMTDKSGKALTQADPFAYVNTTGGRNAADELKGTPYGRPEDLAVNTLASNNEAIYCALTSENRVISIELLSDTKCMVRVFCDFDTIHLATGKDVNPTQNDPYTSPGPDSATNFDDPDNLAVDHNGSIYILEDEGPGDMWKCFDADRDGVAESMAIWGSLGVAGSEPTGLHVHPTMPGRFIVCVQHPSSGDDALWQIDTDSYPGNASDLVLATGVNRAASYGPGESVLRAVAQDSIQFDILSPKSTHSGSPYVLLIRPLKKSREAQSCGFGVPLAP